MFDARTLRVRAGLALLVLGTSVGCDQVTKRIATATLMGQRVKSYAGDLVRLEYARNRGAFLSLGANLPDSVRYWLFTVGVGLFLLYLLYVTLTQPRFTTAQRCALLLMVGGGVSNAWDRFAAGLVTDFMNLGIGSLRTGIFNVADLAIVGGVAIMALAGRAKSPASHSANMRG